jgi:DNA primase
MIENKNDSYNLANQIIEKCDIVGVIGSFIKLTKKGANYVAVCPFHSDTNPSLSVSPTKKI